LSLRLSFFLLTLPPPPPPPLFPYTTLFRSTAGTGGYAEYATASAETTFPLPDELDDGTALALLIQGLTAWHLFRTSAQLREGERDRKSTRLNSSHVAISYAVFCLKKKNKKE